MIEDLPELHFALIRRGLCRIILFHFCFDRVSWFSVAGKETLILVWTLMFVKTEDPVMMYNEGEITSLENSPKR